MFGKKKNEKYKILARSAVKDMFDRLRGDNGAWLPIVNNSLNYYMPDNCVNKLQLTAKSKVGKEILTLLDAFESEVLGTMLTMRRMKTFKVEYRNLVVTVEVWKAIGKVSATMTVTGWIHASYPDKSIHEID
jgi:hypothetical protein